MSQISYNVFYSIFSLFCILCVPENRDPGAGCVTGTYSADDIREGTYLFKNNIFSFGAWDYELIFSIKDAYGLECVEIFEDTICGLPKNKFSAENFSIDIIGREDIFLRNGEYVNAISYDVTRNGNMTHVFSTETGMIVAFSMYIERTGKWVKYVACNQDRLLHLHASEK